jgi:SpoVK/Ycf46/Vps4 family AAA+-type ATPase
MEEKKFCWITNDEKSFSIIPRGVDSLIPGIYTTSYNMWKDEFYFTKVSEKKEEVIDFKSSNSHKVIEDIEEFWKNEEVYRSFNLSYKRGILLYGPQGTGKSSVIQIICDKVIEAGGIVVKMDNPLETARGMRQIREVQSKTPLVILMEDIDGIMEKHDEGMVLNILDGIEQTENIIYLSTTNYIEKLEDRVKNRPCRFDRKFKIDYLTEDDILLYLSHLVNRNKDYCKDIDIQAWARDLANSKLSVAHIREFFVSVVINNINYYVALRMIKEMHLREESDREKMGFLRKKSGEEIE